MLFRKWGCLVGPENSIFRKLKSVDSKKQPLTTEMLLHFYFPFKAFPENERERESTRAHERGEDPGVIASSSSSPRSRAPVRAPAPIRGVIAIAARSSLMIFFFLGCGLCFLICVFLLLFQTPNTRKYFPENFLKCNQTHGNIFLFRKLAFPKICIFRKTFSSNQTQPKTKW